ncbi:hypothetical protein NP493_483g01023 [Ridgeia piscesae]|uniref:Protein FAM91A1 n=2 Tax=Ridgeia piscesae TaxID=27915 RepID=A0AAD9KYA1_RIDPI|nr:hypothetical protein NP493_483g01023 [Ridgeia piscesae]
MNVDIELHIRNGYPWSRLPANVRQNLGNSQREYEKAVVNFSVKNQLRYKGNLVRHVRKDEQKYYEELLRYSREHLMLYPYHLSDVLVKGLRVTPFSYYISVTSDIMVQEKSYDALPNFTAADCLRLLGVGRNQYIDLMNECRSSKKFFWKKSVRELLPPQPVETVTLEPSWVAQAGYITEDDVKICSNAEKEMIDMIIDKGPQLAGHLNSTVLHSLYRKGLVYLDVPVADDDYIIVPPLEGFVMNRVLGDYFEILLYKIFVSIDEHTTVAKLASVLEIDLQLVKNAVSLYRRLGFAKKKGEDTSQDEYHSTWRQREKPSKTPTQDQLLIDWSTTIADQSPCTDHSSSPDSSSTDVTSEIASLPTERSKRIAFLFDSTLTAFLMMGNLSPGLKSHAVTMFEVGKLSDESLDSFLAELEKVDSEAEGEAQRYFDHALTLRSTIQFLRYNSHLVADSNTTTAGQGIDLLRCESLLSLDPATCARVLHRNYFLLVSMAPLSSEVRPVSSCNPQHIGPAIPEVNSVWFKLFLYQLTGSGPPSLLLVKGTRLRRLPKLFQEYDRLLVTTWGHDPGVIGTSNIILTLNDALSHSAVFIQGDSWRQTDGQTHIVPFPINSHCASASDSAASFEQHPALQILAHELDLRHTCGYITLLKTGKSETCKQSPLVVGDETSTGQSMQCRNNSSSPHNGITNTVSAEMLAFELDSLDVSVGEKTPRSMNADRTGLKLDIGVTGSEPLSQSCDLCNYSDWVLLDCCYGIPLFDAGVNRAVCDRIASHKLCNTDSLQELLQSSRKLSLDLLSFISHHQDLPVLEENSHDMAMLTSDLTGQSVPLPTHNILFCDGQMTTWSGQ